MKHSQYILLLSLSALLLSGCGGQGDSASSSKGGSSLVPSSSNPPASSSRKDLTEEEIFAEWNKGAQAFFDEENTIYSAKKEYAEKEEGSLYYKELTAFGKKDEERFRITEEYSLNDDDVLEKSSVETFAFKKVIDNGNLYYKAFTSVENEEGIEKEGAYISPDAVETWDSFPTLDEFAGDFFFGEAEDYSSFLTNTQEMLVDYFDEEGTISFRQKEDGSYLFSIAIDWWETPTSEYDDWDREDHDDVYEVTVKEGETVCLSKKEISEIIKDGVVVEKTESETTYVLEFGEFSEETFNVISIETDTTENYYHNMVNFTVEGAFLNRFDNAFIYEEYTKEDAESFLKGSRSFFGGTPIDSSRYASCLSFYLDADYKTPFEKMDVEEEGVIELYVKFNMPSDLAVVVTMFEEGGGYDYHASFVLEVGDEFNGETTLTDYRLVSIDGKEWKEGDSKKVPLTESKAYVLVYDRANP